MLHSDRRTGRGEKRAPDVFVSGGSPTESRFNRLSWRYFEECQRPLGGASAPWELLLPPEPGTTAREELPAVWLILLHEFITQSCRHPPRTSFGALALAVSCALGPGLSIDDVQRVLRAVLRPIRFGAPSRDSVLATYADVLLRIQQLRERYFVPGDPPLLSSDEMSARFRDFVAARQDSFNATT